MLRVTVGSKGNWGNSILHGAVGMRKFLLSTISTITNAEGTAGWSLG